MKNTLKILFCVCLIFLLAVGTVRYFINSIDNISDEQLLENKQQLEQALHQACVACYAVEGCYPPSLEHLQQYYGIQVNTELFTVKYEIFASNLMPDITVLVN